MSAGEVRVSLLRAPAYAGHPVDDVTPIVRQDRFEPRMDQGEHVFRFWLNGGRAAERQAAIDREASIRSDGLMALCAFPSGAGQPALPGVVVDDPSVRLGALKMSESGDRLVIRLFEPTGAARAVRLRVPPIGLDIEVALGAFELKTLAVDLATGTVAETDLLEREATAG